ncbi:unnamed protein product [Trichobilharzia regenti]|nr:unnamed protein product [Trichobilharzia regenti]
MPSLLSAKRRVEVSTNHSHHNNISNDAKTSSRRSQKVSVNENIDYADVDFVDSVDTINSNANNNTSNTNCSSKDFDKDDTASYWSTRRMQRLHSHKHCINTTSSAAMTTTSNDSNVNDDMHGHKSLRTTLNYSVNRLNTSSRSQLNLANKAVMCSTR